MNRTNTKSIAGYEVANGSSNGLDHPRRLFKSSKNNLHEQGKVSNVQNSIPFGIPNSLANSEAQGQLNSLSSSFGASNVSPTAFQPKQQPQQPQQQQQIQQQLQQQLQQQIQNQMQQSQQQPQQQPAQMAQQQQQMPFNNGPPYNARGYYPMGPYQGSSFPYQQMSYPMYPMTGYGMGMAPETQFSSPTNIPVDGFVTDFGGDFKILGYDNAVNPNMNSQARNVTYSNPQTKNSNVRSNGNMERQFPMY